MLPFALSPIPPSAMFALPRFRRRDGLARSMVNGRAVLRRVGRRAAGGALAAALLWPVACARNAAPDPNAVPMPEVGPTTVRVQNQAFLDVAVYVVRGGLRSRIGTVTGNSTAVLTIPKSLVLPLTQLRFIANPIGGRAQPVSEEITVSPGDEVALIVPPSR